MCDSLLGLCTTSLNRILYRFPRVPIINKKQKSNILKHPSQNKLQLLPSTCCVLTNHHPPFIFLRHGVQTKSRLLAGFGSRLSAQPQPKKRSRHQPQWADSLVRIVSGTRPDARIEIGFAMHCDDISRSSGTLF